jgi:dethiobiotin synthetase
MPSNLKPTGFFVTGTDTEVGKTLVSGALLLQLQKKYLKVIAYKPVVAGLRLIDGQLQNEDLISLATASSHEAAKNVSNICPYILETPSAPHLVAQKNHIKLSYEKMLGSYEALAQQTDAIVVEGVGGFKVPFHEGKNSADFAKDLALPVILVVGMRLGCINHALITIEAIQSRGLLIAGWVANCISDMHLLDQNIESLKDMIDAPLLGVIPKLDPQLIHTPYTKSALEKAATYIKLPS